MATTITFEKDYTTHMTGQYRHDTEEIVKKISLRRIIGEFKVYAELPIEEIKNLADLQDRSDYIQRRTRNKQELCEIINRLVPEGFVLESVLGTGYNESRTNVKVTERNTNFIYRLFRGKTMKNKITITNKLYSAGLYDGKILDNSPRAEHYAIIKYKTR